MGKKCPRIKGKSTEAPPRWERYGKGQGSKKERELYKSTANWPYFKGQKRERVQGSQVNLKTPTYETNEQEQNKHLSIKLQEILEHRGWGHRLGTGNSKKNTTGEFKPVKGAPNLTLSPTMFHNVDINSNCL